jgi:malonyl CoA-acyl carrier protein transacylase
MKWMAGTALLFPGQGSHAADMDAPWRGTPLFERGLELLGYDPFADLGLGTRVQQPAIFLVCACAWDTHDESQEEERGPRLDGHGPAASRPVPPVSAPPMAAAGHSLGEYAALHAAGALTFDDALLLVDERAAAMQDAATAQPGGMVAMLGGDPHAVTELARTLGLTVANDNAPGQVVLSGPLEMIDTAVELARSDAGARGMKLDVAGAFHSPLMEPAAERLRAALAATPIAEPAFPVWSNGSAAPFTDIRRELSENLLKPVRWRETLLALRAHGVERFVELGPGEVLTGMVKRTLAVAA